MIDFKKAINTPIILEAPKDLELTEENLKRNERIGREQDAFRAMSQKEKDAYMKGLYDAARGAA